MIKTGKYEIKQKGQHYHLYRLVHHYDGLVIANVPVNRFDDLPEAVAKLVQQMKGRKKYV